MLFNSLTFLAFFALVLGLHRLPIAWRAKKFNLLVASYIFYSAWNPVFLPLLMATTILDWAAGSLIYKAKTPTSKRAYLIISLVGNLGMLSFFKYGEFFLENFTRLVQGFGIHYAPPQWSLLLPLGISFYTFHSLSYVLDLYRGKAKPVESFLDYALFVTFFPTLVAGPILRVHQFAPQLVKPKAATGEQFSRGLGLLVLGLFEKCVLADGVFAPVVNAVYDSHQVPDFFSAWSAPILFGSQIFCDFAGYSTCAVGTGLCFGFLIPNNFRNPFAAVGFFDLWSRWHISLSTWMRDYVFLSMRGSLRRGTRASFNLFFTMAIVGLWHGASWTFVVWGSLQGGLLILEQYLRRWWGNLAFLNTLPGQLGLALLTSLVARLTNVFFRAGSLSEACRIFKGLTGAAGEGALFSVDRLDAGVAWGVAAAIFAWQWWNRDEPAQKPHPNFGWGAQVVGVSIMLVLIIIASGEDNAFIYFQF